MPPLRLSLSIVLAALVASVTLNVVVPTGPAVAAARGLTLAPAPPIKGESFRLSGRLSTGFERPVKLQRRYGDSWVAVTRSTATRSGSYSFASQQLWTTRSYRALAPATRHDGRRYPSLTSRVRTVVPVGQTARLRMLPQIAQPGGRIASAADARNAITGEFSPARPGRKVVLQRLDGSSWTKVAIASENRLGIAQFTAPARVGGRPATYRAFARRAHGAPRVVTDGRSTDVWGEPDFSDSFNGTTLSSAWANRVPTYNPEGRRKCSKGSSKAVSVSSGAVHLKVLKDWSRRATKCRAYDAKGNFLGRYSWRLNGHISTEGKRFFRYGFSAARVKFQPLRGQHGSFWMQPETYEEIPGNPRRSGAEIDVVEYFGRNHPSGGLSSYAYYLGKDGSTVQVGGWLDNPDRFLAGRVDSWFSRYHVFSVEWTPTRYIYRIDGRETFRTYRGVSGQPEYLILSLLSSDYELRYLGPDSNLPQQMSVDWVRYWQR